MAAVLPLRTAWLADILSQASLRDVQRQRCWKRGTCSGDGQSLWDYCTARLNDLSVPLTGEVWRSPEPSATPSAGADSEERQIFTTCLFAESVGLCLCFLPSCAMYKDNAVENVVAETGRDLVFMTTARLSDLSMPLKGEVRRSPEQSAWQPIARSGKFVRRASSRRALGCEESLMLSPIVEHTSVWEGLQLGEEGRFDSALREIGGKTHTFWFDWGPAGEPVVVRVRSLAQKPLPYKVNKWRFRSDCLLPSEIGTSWCGRILHSMAFVLFCLYLSKKKKKKRVKYRPLWQLNFFPGHHEPVDRHWPPVKS